MLGQTLLFLIGIIVFSVPVFLSAGITLHAANRERAAEQDAKMLQYAPEQFQRLIGLETSRTATLVIGAAAWLLAVILLVFCWLTNQMEFLRLGVILAAAGILLLIAGIVLSRKAKKLRGTLREQYALGEVNKLGLRDIVEQIPTELEEHMAANVRIQQGELQAMDMLMRRDKK